MANERHMRDPYVIIIFLLCCCYNTLISRVRIIHLKLFYLDTCIHLIK